MALAFALMLMASPIALRKNFLKLLKCYFFNLCSLMRFTVPVNLGLLVSGARETLMTANHARVQTTESAQIWWQITVARVPTDLPAATARIALITVGKQTVPHMVPALIC